MEGGGAAPPPPSFRKTSSPSPGMPSATVTVRWRPGEREAGGGGRVSGPFLGHSMSGEQIVRHGRFVHTLLAEGLPLQEISSPFPAMSR